MDSTQFSLFVQFIYLFILFFFFIIITTWNFVHNSSQVLLYTLKFSPSSHCARWREFRSMSARVHVRTYVRTYVLKKRENERKLNETVSHYCVTIVIFSRFVLKRVSIIYLFFQGKNDKKLVLLVTNDEK